MSRMYHSCLLLAPLVAAASGSDMVNERIPVTPAELESHWQVDCRAVWTELGRALRPAPVDGTCTVLANSRRALQLCAFIYQPPGGKGEWQCPDYRGMSGLLEPGGEGGDCAAMVDLFLAGEACRPGRMP